MRVTFSPQALDKARHEIALLADPSAGVLIYLGDSGVDSKRGADGGVIWSRRKVEGWRVWCLPLSELPSESQRIEVSGITVMLFSVLDESSSFRIRVKRGKLHASIGA